MLLISTVPFTLSFIFLMLQLQFCHKEMSKLTLFEEAIFLLRFSFRKKNKGISTDGLRSSFQWFWVIPSILLLRNNYAYFLLLVIWNQPLLFLIWNFAVPLSLPDDLASLLRCALCLLVTISINRIANLTGPIRMLRPYLLIKHVTLQMFRWNLYDLRS